MDDPVREFKRGPWWSWSRFQAFLRTALHHRMVTLMACAFGMSACYALGLMSHFYPALMALSLAVITLLATMVCRF